MHKYLILLISLLISLPVYGLSRLGLWTSQKNIDIAEGAIPSNRSDNAIVDISLMNLNIGYQQGSVAMTNASINQPQGIFQQFTASQKLANIDIMGALQNSTNRKKTLETYLSDIQKSNRNIQQLKNKLNQQISDETSKYNECQTSKLQGDGLYYQGIEQLNTYDLKNGLEQAVTYGKCAIEHRIRANAASALYNKLIVYTETLSYRYSILSTNKDLILSNFNMFKDSYLEKLIVVRDAFGGIPESLDIRPQD